MLAELEQSRTSGPKTSGLSMSSITIGSTSDPKTISKGCSYLPNRSELSASTKLPTSLTGSTGYTSGLGASSSGVSLGGLTNQTSSPYSTTSALTNGGTGLSAATAAALSSAIGPSASSGLPSSLSSHTLPSAFTATSLLDKTLLDKTLYSGTNTGMHIPPMQPSFQHTIKNMPVLSQVKCLTIVLYLAHYNSIHQNCFFYFIWVGMYVLLFIALLFIYYITE